MLCTIIECVSLCVATVAARRAAEEAGRDGPKAAKATSFTGMSIQEAQQILNLKDIKDIPIIRKVNGAQVGMVWRYRVLFFPFLLERTTTTCSK